MFPARSATIPTLICTEYVFNTSRVETEFTNLSTSQIEVVHLLHRLDSILRIPEPATANQQNGRGRREVD